ncbi:MAG TPA: NAD(P)H-binding protein [Jatrophihabitantaceae bacterium]|nr:NAD(P)H-binding protein [Jatrophihabitantaceae bacterium]
MTELVVVAGATGYLGRHVVAAFAGRGYRVRAIVRSRARAEEPGAFAAPALAGLVDEWLVGEVTDPGFLPGACQGAQRVVSALGVTRQKASPWDVDYLANLRLLQDAERERVGSFLYVNVMHASAGRSLIMRSKSAFAEALTRSPLAHQVINPSGYFSDLAGILQMARRRIVILPPDLGVHIAPIHGADLARCCIDRLGDVSGSWDVGGPDVLTYREIADLAATALGKRCVTLTVPMGAVRAAVWVARRFGERPATLAQFFADGLARDAVGKRCGEHHLDAFFRDLTGTDVRR